jgi:hypothetical protein
MLSDSANLSNASSARANATRNTKAAARELPELDAGEDGRSISYTSKTLTKNWGRHALYF